MLYWADWGAAPGIYRSSVTNPVCQTLVTSGIVTPTALTVDFTGN